MCVTPRNKAGEVCSERLDFYRKDVRLRMTNDHLVSILNTWFEQKLYFACRQTLAGCPKAMLSWLSIVEHKMPCLLSVDACRSNFIYISSLSRVGIAHWASKHSPIILAPWPLDIDAHLCHVCTSLCLSFPCSMPIYIQKSHNNYLNIPHGSQMANTYVK